MNSPLKWKRAAGSGRATTHLLRVHDAASSTEHERFQFQNTQRAEASVSSDRLVMLLSQTFILLHVIFNQCGVLHAVVVMWNIYCNTRGA